MPRSSDTPLAEKLGLKAGARLMLAGEIPTGFTQSLAPMPVGVTPLRWPDDHATGPADVIVYFTRRRAALVQDLIGLTAAITPAGGLWVAWPKRNSKVQTDMSEDVVRDVALPIGVVDNKVCALDETWAGLRLVWRKSNRPK